MATMLVIVGDLISEGSAGDDLSRPQPNADSEDYADLEFDENHLAMGGQPLVEVVGKVGSRVCDFDPDIVLTLLGVNDLIGQDRTAIQRE